MANNRIYLRCQVCGDVLLLGKSHGGAFWSPDYIKLPIEERLNDFFDKHSFCKAKRAKRGRYSESEFPFPEKVADSCGAFDVVYECIPKY